MTILLASIALIIVLGYLFCIGIFFRNLNAIRLSGMLLWGIFLISNIGILGIAEVSSHFLFPTMSKEACLALFSNILMIAELAIILIMYAQFVIVQKNLLIGIFITFMAMWLTEFVLKGEFVSLSTAEFFLQVIIVLLSLNYLLKLHSQAITDYYKTPFFWIAIGWLISSLISVVLFIPNIASKAAIWSKEIVILITGIAQILSFVLYSIGFRKTKQWVVQNPTQAWKI
jgi:hypothetical protein